MTDETAKTATDRQANEITELSNARPPDMGRLVEGLKANPVLAAAIQEALDCGCYLVTVHRKVKDSPPDDLQSRSVRVHFPVECVVDAMQALCRSILTDDRRDREQGLADMADRNRWE